MFSNALKSFTSNITSNYTLSPAPTSQSGPWKIYDAKKKKTNQPVSVWTFERRSLDSPGAGSSSNGLSLRGGNPRDGLRAAQDEVVERLKKEASLLARLRHPCVLELVEPVEDTRGGGLMFATEHVLCSLGVLLAEKDEEEGRGGSARRKREVDIDELEIQKGLLQIGKALEFLHESAGLVHANITPEAVVINAKSDWKLTSLSFTISSISPPTPPTFDPRLPAFVQHCLDFSAPDLTIDNTLAPTCDLFSLGLLVIALYNHPHRSPLETHNSTSTYRRLLTSASTTPGTHNNFLSTRPLPRALTDSLLPSLLTRHPSGRCTARVFQQSPYFDNILVSALRFLDGLAGKTPNEKASFMRGLLKVLPQFPRSVLEKKILPGLVEELRDGSTLALVLPNIFAIAESASARIFSERVLGRLKEVFVNTSPPSTNTEHKSAAAKIAEREKDAGKEGGLTVVLANLTVIMAKTTAREFKDDILPIYQLALESPTHALQDLALRSLHAVLPKLDFPTLKNDVFPLVAGVFTRTSSLGIKIRGLEAFKVLCGGTPPDAPPDAYASQRATRKEDCPVLDKYTIQEKVVPLLKGIKTKEPAVMMAALDVFAQIGSVCDREVVAMELLPGLWAMSLGPLLGLSQFQAFMATIKSLSLKIEHEQTRKLQELGVSATSNPAGEFLSFGGIPGASSRPASEPDADFESLVFGKKPSSPALGNGWGTPTPQQQQQQQQPPPPRKVETPAFSWSTPTAAATPDTGLGSLSFTPMTPASMSTGGMGMGTGRGMNVSLPQTQRAQTAGGGGGAHIDWSTAAGSRTPGFSVPMTPRSPAPSTPGFAAPVRGFPAPAPAAAVAAAPMYPQVRQQAQMGGGGGAFAGFMIPPPPVMGGMGMNMGMGMGMGSGMGMGGGMNLVIGSGPPKKEEKTLDQWESLL